MKQDTYSILEIFQDPLLTIIALVLLGTVWMVLPGESELVDPKTVITIEKIDFLKKEVETMEEKIQQLELEIRKLEEKIKWIENMKEKAKSDNEKHNRDLEQIDKELAILRGMLEEKRKELKQLEAELEKLRSELAETAIKNKEAFERLLAYINKLNRKIEKKKEGFGLLEEKIKKAKENWEKTKEKQAAQKKQIARLENDLMALSEKIKEFEAEIEKRGKKPTVRLPDLDTKKNPVVVELVNNRLFPVDSSHYDKSVYQTVEGGKIVTHITETRKSYVSGESIDEIQKQNSNFYKILKEISPEKNYILFLLHNDSFEIFKKARKLAWDEKIETGWDAWEGEAITSCIGCGWQTRPPIK